MPDHANWTPPVRGSGRVLFPTSVDPREYLMGVVLRAASDNAHMNVSAILASSGYPHARSFDLALSRLENVDELATVLGVDRDELAGLTFRPRRSFRHLTTVSFLGGEASSYDIVTRRRRLSGATLRSEAFHRAVWTHGLLPYCPASLELLIDRCPRCGQKLDWFRATPAGEPSWQSPDINAILRCGDPKCGYDLRDTSSSFLDDRLVGSYRAMAGLVAPGDRQGCGIDLPPALQALSSGACFELGWSLARVFAHDGVTRARSKTLDVETVLSTLNLAQQFLSDWPDRFQFELEASVRNATTEVAAQHVRRLKALTRAKAMWPEVIEIVKQAYPALLKRDRETLRLLNPSIVTRTDAVEMCGMTARSFARAATSQGLKALSTRGDRRTFQDFDVAAIEELRDAKAASIPLDSVAERLGISYHGVEQLAVIGLLRLEEHPALAATYRLPRVLRSSLEGLVEQLIRRSRAELSGPLIPLHIAIKCLQGEKPWAAILQAMLDGNLPFALDPDVVRVARGVSVPPQSVDLLRSFSFRRGDYPDFPFATDMSRRDAEEALNLVPSTLLRALEQELGSARSRGRLKVGDVAAIAARVISAAEISARTRPGTRRLPRELKRSRYKRIGAGGWSRREIESFLAGRKN